MKTDVTVREADGDVILEGEWAKVNTAINNIKDAIAETFCGASGSLNHMNGSTTRTVDKRSDKLNRVGAENDSVVGKQRSVSVTLNTDHSRMTAADKHHSLENSHSRTTSASSQMCESPLTIDDHTWHYIEFKYPEMYRHWQQMLVLSQNTSAKVIEITGQLQDVINFSEWFKKHDLISVRRSIIDLPSNIDVNRLKLLVSSTEAAKFGVYVRLVHNKDMECIGKSNEIDDLVSWLNVALRDFKDHEAVADIERSAHVNGSSTADSGSLHVSGPVAGANQVVNRSPIILHADRDRLKFQTAESQLEVEVLNGDLTRQKSEVIVNPANKYLLHSGGAAKVIQSAAGCALMNECKDYIRKHKELPTSEVMHTTSGKLPRPINYVIHACGPNARDHPDDKQCLRLLEKTFLNCFVYANDTLRVRSLALPAISSGIIFLQ